MNGNIFKFSCLIRCVYFLVSPLFSTFLCRVFVVFFFLCYFQNIELFQLQHVLIPAHQILTQLCHAPRLQMHTVYLFYCLRKKQVKGISNVGKQFGHV